MSLDSIHSNKNSIDKFGFHEHLDECHTNLDSDIVSHIRLLIGSTIFFADFSDFVAKSTRFLPHYIHVFMISFSWLDFLSSFAASSF